MLTALQFTPVSYVAPLREISILFGTLIGVKWLNEGIGIQRVVSSVIIVAGVMMIAYTTI
ncbi:EamA-like transporter family protein [Salimicrobium flavidum]|uniref:EamA-like transporter family protein n=1 Tax=Salimicrobium flavidum TaxID=570947 RepID=A0A1N7KSK1_9BACI|nr:EamA-like transporter family protein [Salimicrobium flavidum]